MNRLTVFAFLLSFQAAAASGQTPTSSLFLCRSPLLAVTFWQNLKNMAQQGVQITPTIAAEVCDGMLSGGGPQCIRVEAPDFKPFSSGWDGTMAMTDGTTTVWFQNPESYGWITSDYYIMYLNHHPY